MTNKQGHTPEPWGVDPDFPHLVVIPGGAKLYDQPASVDVIADCPKNGSHEANAAHIVLCVNTHADLLAALEAVQKHLPFHDSEACDCGPLKSRCKRAWAHETARAAIAKAKG